MSTVTAIPAPRAVFREEQLFSWWVYAGVSLVLFVSGLYLANRPPVGPGAHAGFPGAALLAMLLGMLLVVLYLKMTTQVTTARVEVWFGWIPTYRRSVDVGSIARVEVVAYHPLKDCGGWGIRAFRDGERVLNARGDRGVRLHFNDGARLLIGSQHPEALAAAIEAAIRPA